MNWIVQKFEAFEAWVKSHVQHANASLTALDERMESIEKVTIQGLANRVTSLELQLSEALKARAQPNPPL